MKVKGILWQRGAAVLLTAAALLPICGGTRAHRETVLPMQESEEETTFTGSESTEKSVGTETADTTAAGTTDAGTTEAEPLPETTAPDETTAADPEEDPAATEETKADTTKAKVKEKIPLTEYTDGAYTYYIDVSSYLQYIVPEDTEKYLILANRANPLPDCQNWVPSDLTVTYGSSTKMERGAAMAMKAMILEAKALGKYDSSPSSGYRSYSTQASLYKLYRKQEAANHPKYSEEKVIALVDTYSARPGTSEHQTGLAIDFYPINQYFAYRNFYKYLVDNAHRFGFILRYRKGDEDITGYRKEPWHWRFVGREAASYIHAHGITLEEYLEILYPGRYPTLSSFYETSGVTTAPPPDTQPHKETGTTVDTGTAPGDVSSDTAEESSGIPDTVPADISSHETAMPEETDGPDPGGTAGPPESAA